MQISSTILTSEDEAWLNIFKYLTPEEWVYYGGVSKRWHFLLRWPLLWCRVKYLDELDYLSYWSQMEEQHLVADKAMEKQRVLLLRLFAALCRQAGPYLESAKVELSDAANLVRDPILTCLTTYCPGIQDLEIRVVEASNPRTSHELIRNIPNFAISLESLWLEFGEISLTAGQGSLFFEQLFVEIAKLGRLSSLHVGIGPTAAFRLKINNDSLATAGLTFWSTVEKNLNSLSSLSLDIPLHSFMDYVKPHRFCSCLSKMTKLRLLSLLCPFDFPAPINELFKSMNSVQFLATSLQLNNRQLQYILRKMPRLSQLALMAQEHCITTGGLESAIYDRPSSFPSLLIYFKLQPIVHPRTLGSYDMTRTSIWFENDLQDDYDDDPATGSLSRASLSCKSRWELRTRQFILHQGIFTTD